MTHNIPGAVAIVAAMVGTSSAPGIDQWTQYGALALLGALLYGQFTDRKAEREWKAQREDKQHEFMLQIFERFDKAVSRKDPD